MLDYFLKAIDELYNIVMAPIDNTYKRTAIDKYKGQLNLKEERFSTLYTKFIKKQTGKAYGIVYTPKDIANYMFNNVIKDEDIIENPFLKIIDPACGCGDILICCFEKLKNIYRENLDEINRKHTLNIHYNNIEVHIINNNLYCSDIDIAALKILSIDLFQISGYINEKNIMNEDFLIWESEVKYDIIIGNPPYIGHKLINKDYSKRLKEIYKNVYKDKGDISYCFFQGAINKLKKKGKLAFITSRYFIESPSGEELRKILKDVCSVYKIIDFYGIRPFKNVGIDPVIIFLINDTDIVEEIEIIKPLRETEKVKNYFYKSLFLEEGKGFKQFYLPKNCLNNKGWILRDERERNIIAKIEEKSFTHLYNICNSYQGIITGCDRAFVVDENIIKEKNLEIEIIKPWIKSSFITKDKLAMKKSYLIYSDSITNPKNYPNIIDHLEKEKHKLIERRECKNGIRKWYELQWGRKSEIFEKEKIIYPYKSNNNKFLLDRGNYFSADIYALILKDNVPFTYKYLLSLLNSKVYEFYFQSFAKKLGEKLYEYYPNNLMKLCIPTMGSKEEYTDEEINQLFGFKEEELEIIYGKNET